MGDGVQIRLARSRADYDACVLLQREVWGLSDLEVTSAIQLIATVHAGGLLLIAEDENGGAVGFCYAFAGFDGHEAYLHSDMLAVRLHARGHGVGQRLKWAQREEALRRGLRRVEWTFDPLRAGNARLNLHYLGATARQYLPDLYGRTSSALHLGLPTDRLLARWDLDSPRVLALAAGTDPEEAAAADLGAPASRRRIEIPACWEAVAADADLAAEWQSQVRAQFQEAFAAGFAASDVGQAPDGRAYYVLIAAGSSPVAAGSPGSDDHSLHDPA